ncbi:MAG TPA: peptidase U32 family protein [Bacteroidales bacterium]|nr:peptidase U32 family protein [Bacteroidales bacterium]
MQRKEIEIMAPVGSYESLMAAIQGGADSVYFGVGELNMRSKSSSNFNYDDLKKIVEIAHDHKLKTYLTINTVVYNHELAEMRRMVDAAKNAGVTAIIASDQAVLAYASKQNVEVHISTQLNVSNIETIEFYSNFADVMVLARELTLDQVSEIYKLIQEREIRGPAGELIRLELFAHGALCMSISGKCYLSLHEYNFSANRGKCLQNCRRSYLVTDRESGAELEIENQYIMSPKDLSTIHFLNKILDAGVRVLKLEGRARPPEYVKNVSSCYNEAISAIVEGTYTKEKIEAWQQRLSEVFNRDFWDGYYLGQRLGEWSEKYGSRATKKKRYVGKGMNYFSRLGVAEFLMETGDLSVGDEIIITGPTTGVIETKVEELRVDLKPVNKTTKGERFSMPVTSQIRRSDKLYKVIKEVEKNKTYI